MDYCVNIGIEVHVQLITNSKIFCSCQNGFSTTSNSQICPICSGQPGILPVLNQFVPESAVRLGLATNCQISEKSEFARKHYFYPDLPKNYQITQSDNPICKEGKVTIRLEDGSLKDIRLIRIHIEEDAGKNIHSQISNESFVDLNRAGTPLLEVVTYPDISSAYEAREYLKALRQIVEYLGICTGNMEEGAFRADTNISIRPKHQEQLGTKCELKNINSFKFISDAIEYEISRQKDLLESGNKVKQETRLWDTKEKRSVSMRSKEEAADYRYLNDPDLPILHIDQNYIDNIKNKMPELPFEKFNRLCTQGLTSYEADIIVGNLDLANYYETASKINNSKTLINWILRDVMGLLKDQKISLKECKITAEMIAELTLLIDTKIINNKSAQEVFAVMAKTGEKASHVVKTLGLEQSNDYSFVETILKEVISENPNQVAEYKSGNEKIFAFLVGQAMKKSKGKADPQGISDMLKKLLI